MCNLSVCSAIGPLFIISMIVLCRLRSMKTYLRPFSADMRQTKSLGGAPREYNWHSRTHGLLCSMFEFTLATSKSILLSFDIMIDFWRWRDDKVAGGGGAGRGRQMKALEDEIKTVHKYFIFKAGLTLIFTAE